MATATEVGPDRNHDTHAPVRDDSKTGYTEDLDREPDGVPHSVVGYTAGFAVVLSLLVAMMFIAGGTVGKVAAILLALVAIPVMVGGLRKKAARDRDHMHPSR